MLQEKTKYGHPEHEDDYGRKIENRVSEILAMPGLYDRPNIFPMTDRNGMKEVMLQWWIDEDKEKEINKFNEGIVD